MARFKPSGARKAKPEKTGKGYIGCIIIILAAFALVFWLLFAVMRSGK
jgi:hypothetical protein